MNEKRVRIFFFFFAAIDCAIQSEKLTAPRVLAAFFSLPSYLDHVRSNNHARLFSYPRPYFYTYVNIHICRYRIYVATPVPQRVKSTFYFDEPSGYDTRSRRYPRRPIILFFSIRTCFHIPPELLILFHVSPREFDRSFAWKFALFEKFLRMKSRRKIHTTRTYTIIRIEIYTRSWTRRYLRYRNENIWSALLKQ